MRKSELTVGIGGAAGDGQASIGDTLAKTCARLGLHIFVYNSYQSVIRGGHVWLRLRASGKKIYSHGDHLDAVIALNQDCFDRHAAEVDEGGVVIFNGDKLELNASRLKPKVRSIALPIAELMAPFGRQPAVMQNTVALGALVHLTDLDFDFLKGVLSELFARKGEEVINTNVGLAQAGFDYAAAQHAQMGYDWKFTGKHRAVLSGNEAFGIGAVAAGCTFYAAYPMTPASSILHFMANHAEKYGIVVKQVEDEIGVLNMAIGAGHAGARALVATSGGGFSLMTEAIGLAGMTETPVVIINSMRGGPSTGLPTKTEQGDLNQVFGASQGEYPRIIAAPCDPVDAFDTMTEAFNIAERYQVPVIVVSDLLLSEHRETVDPDQFNFEAPIMRGELAANGNEAGNGAYKRYAFTASGISPRALPGNANPDTVYVAASDEHDEQGILISDVFTNPATRKQMMEKRMRKMDGMISELAPPQLEGDPNAEVTLIGWGSCKGVIQEAIAQLAEEGVIANQVHIKYLAPFHAEVVANILARCRRTVCVEVNYTGQLARHLRAETGVKVDHKILRYDGEPFEPAQIAAEVKAFLRTAVAK